MVKRWLARLHEYDLRAFRWVARSESDVLDATLPRLSTAANHSVLWMGVAALLWLFGGRWGRRAATRGLLSIGATSGLVNPILKQLMRRRRPLETVPELRRLARVPVSSSFPSGHSASAAAFATGVAIEQPALAVPIGVVAAAVGYSRIYTGVHYPGDVIAGAALGTAIAIASKSRWPVAPHESPTAPPVVRRGHAEPSSDGEGLVIAVNAASGSGGGDSITDLLEKSLPRARVVEIDPEHGNELTTTLEEAADDFVAVGVAGGDGSINAAAQVAVDHAKPLVIVPAGTLNHFARDVGLLTPEDAIDAVSSGDAVEVDVASIDGRVFLNTASFGSYVELVDARERLEDKIGKWPAVLVALVKVLRGSEPLPVEIDGEPRRVWMVFIGNCRYHPSGFAPSWRERLDDGHLDVRIVDGGAPWGRVRLIASIVAGRLGRSRVYEQKVVRSLKVKSLDGPLRLARDGETFDGSPEFEITKNKDPLIVYAPSSDDP